MTLNKRKIDGAARQKYEWMSHSARHEVISVGFCDWMEVDVKKKEKGCTSSRRVEARCVCPSNSERVAAEGNLYSCGGPMRKRLFRMHRLTLWISSGKSLAHLPNPTPTPHQLLSSVPSTCSSHPHTHTCTETSSFTDFIHSAAGD